MPAGAPPPAPWSCRCLAVVWSARPPRSAAAWLPPALAGHRPLGMIGGLVRYLDTPVGPYAEVFAAIGVRLGRGLAGHIPFMAVDSAQSVAGGRANWALPKTLATFAGDLPAVEAGGEGWRAAIHARPLGPAVPLRTSGVNVQQWPDGTLRRATLRLRGRMRPALVSVDGEHPLLRAGRYPGALLPEATFVLGTPRPR